MFPNSYIRMSTYYYISWQLTVSTICRYAGCDKNNTTRNPSIYAFGAKINFWFINHGLVTKTIEKLGFWSERNFIKNNVTSKGDVSLTYFWTFSWEIVPPFGHCLCNCKPYSKLLKWGWIPISLPPCKIEKKQFDIS